LPDIYPKANYIDLTGGNLLFKGKVANPSSIGFHNRDLVLQIIEKKGQVSRAELAKLTHLSEPTISAIIEGFLQKDLVREMGPGASVGGRKPVIIEFNPGVGYVIGIDAGGTWTKIGISDFGGKFILKEKISSKELGLGEKAVFELAKRVNQVIEKCGMEKKKILGVGIAVPGIADQDKGMVSFSPVFQWHGFPLVKMFFSELDLPVFIENDLNASAIAEKQWGLAQEYQDFVFLGVSRGIGAGLILNSELYHGHFYAAGEVGYMILGTDCLKQKESPEDLALGRLESMVAEAGVVKRAKELGFTIKKEEKFRDNIMGFSAEDVVKAARDNNEIALQVLDEITDYLASAIINITLVVNPQAVVIGSSIEGAGEILAELLRNKTASSFLVKPLILPSSMGTDAGLIGAASLAAQNIKQTLIS
jgi:Transcriptional regulator/sugar kinase